MRTVKNLDQNIRLYTFKTYRTCQTIQDMHARKKKKEEEKKNKKQKQKDSRRESEEREKKKKKQDIQKRVHGTKCSTIH